MCSINELVAAIDQSIRRDETVYLDWRGSIDADETSVMEHIIDAVDCDAEYEIAVSYDDDCCEYDVYGEDESGDTWRVKIRFDRTY